MEPIHIKKVDEEIVKQYNYLKSLDLSFGWRIHKFWIRIYLIAVVATILLYVCTGSNNFIVLKVMSLVILTLMFLGALIFLAIDLIRKSRHAKIVQAKMNESLQTATEYSIQFNETTITFITEKLKTEVFWNYWQGYREVDGALFLFVNGSLYTSTSFSPAEIGTENFEALKSIVKKELPELEETGLRRWYSFV